MIDTSTKKTFYIDSRQRQSGTSNNFQILPANWNPMNEWNRMAITGGQIPKSWEMLNTVQGNNTFTLTETGGAGPVTGTIASGNYTAVELAQALEDQIHAINISGTGYVVEYVPIRNSFKITCSKAGVTAFELSDMSDDFLKYFGFNGDITSTGLIVFSPNLINLQRYENVIVRCNLAKNWNDNIVLNVNAGDYPYYGTIPIEPITDLSIQGVPLSNNMTNQWEFWIESVDGQVIDLNNGTVILNCLLYKEEEK